MRSSVGLILLTGTFFYQKKIQTTNWHWYCMEIIFLQTWSTGNVNSYGWSRHTVPAPAGLARFCQDAFTAWVEGHILTGNHAFPKVTQGFPMVSCPLCLKAIQWLQVKDSSAWHWALILPTWKAGTSVTNCPRASKPHLKQMKQPWPILKTRRTSDTRRQSTYQELSRYTISI